MALQVDPLEKCECGHSLVRHKRGQSFCYSRGCRCRGHYPASMSAYWQARG